MVFECCANNAVLHPSALRVPASSNGPGPSGRPNGTQELVFILYRSNACHKVDTPRNPQTTLTMHCRTGASGRLLSTVTPSKQHFDEFETSYLAGDENIIADSRLTCFSVERPAHYPLYPWTWHGRYMEQYVAYVSLSCELFFGAWDHFAKMHLVLGHLRTFLVCSAPATEHIGCFFAMQLLHTLARSTRCARTLELNPFYTSRSEAMEAPNGTLSLEVCLALQVRQRLGKFHFSTCYQRICTFDTSPVQHHVLLFCFSGFPKPISVIFGGCNLKMSPSGHDVSRFGSEASTESRL